MPKMFHSLMIAALTSLTPTAAFACMHMMSKEQYQTYPLDYSVMGVLAGSLLVAVMRLRGASQDRMLACWLSSVIAGAGAGLFLASNVEPRLLSGYLFMTILASIPSLMIIRASSRAGWIFSLILALFLSGTTSMLLLGTRDSHENYRDFGFGQPSISEPVVF